MISMFRKEMRKWHSVLWVVFFSMAVGGLIGVIGTRGGGDGSSVASVNGRAVTSRDFRDAMNDLQQKFAFFTTMYGIPLDTLVKTFFGAKDLPSLALDNAIKNKLVDGMKNALDVHMDTETFKNELVRGLPQGIVDPLGNINMPAYKEYVARLSLTPAEFERSKEEELKRNVVQKVIGASSYVPRFTMLHDYDNDLAKKSFEIAQLTKEHFEKEVRTADLSKAEIAEFYDKHSESYRIPEKKRSKFYRLSLKDYEKSVKVDEKSIQNFYEKNRTGRYRIPPRVQVRHIFIEGTDAQARKKADDLFAKVKADKSNFAALATSHSQDKATASHGGLTKDFGRGTFDPSFEKEAFALTNKGDLAKSVVKTAKGFEIIMLENRTNASEKALSDVHDDIEELLLKKKGENSLRAELEAVVRKEKSNDKSLQEFVSAHGLKEETTGLLDPKDATGKDVVAKIAEKIFNKSGSRSLGYFLLENEYVIYSVVEKEKSYIQPLSEVREKIMEDLYKVKAQDAVRLFAKDAKTALLEKKRTLSSLKDEGFRVIKTGLLAKKDSISEFKDAKDLVERAFILDGDAQVCEYRSGSDIFLIQLVNLESKESERSSHAFRNMRNQEKERAAGSVMNGFIASLQRNAKITVDETLMNAYKANNG